MGFSAAPTLTGDTETTVLLPTTTTAHHYKVPKDTFHLAYIIYFTLGFGYLLPWNAFITAVDYFSFIYPDVSVDRTFALSYMLASLLCLLAVVLYAHKSHAGVRINVGLLLLALALLVVPIMDAAYIKGRVGLYDGFYVTVGSLALAGVADSLVQAGLVGSAGELPVRYMQAVVVGTAASGNIIVFFLLNNFIHLVLCKVLLVINKLLSDGSLYIIPCL
ncbi:Epsin-1, required for endocytosis and actin patch assembly [Turnera subulata]|uniref:Epsin-1, required for endocytosis and actin patch assembly n=1 Tax=Turnera subulata TaxID=218843 RepID=A0A9Q0J6F2_9ROSI|nr:Epsin-1, required for endocytosis and actin patch assembly [Turnera subulata]